VSDDLTVDDLAERTGTAIERLRELEGVGVIVPSADGRYRLGDVHRVRIADAFLRSGIPLDALRRASEAGVISFDYYDLLHAPPGRPADRTYGRMRTDIGERAGLLGQLFGAFGIAEPDDGSRLDRGDEALILELLEVVVATGEPDLALRVVRLFGDSLRRATEAVMTVYDEAVGRVVEPVEGLPSQEVFDRYLLPWTHFARIAPRLGTWLTERHLSHAIDAYSVNSTEHFLSVGGFLPARTDTPPGIAFVDLSGFTRLAEERGDEPVARVALEFGRLAEDQARRRDGRLVKLLGDGVLLHFPDAVAAVEATIELLGSLPGAGLPRGHAGIHAGPIIVRDGDIFGRTVNLASRIADLADAGQLLVTRAVADTLPQDRFIAHPLGDAELQGIDERVELLRVQAAGDGS